MSKHRPDQPMQDGVLENYKVGFAGVAGDKTSWTWQKFVVCNLNDSSATTVLDMGINFAQLSHVKFTWITLFSPKFWM